MSDMKTGCRVCGTHWRDVELLADDRCATCLQAEIERLTATLDLSEEYHQQKDCDIARLKDECNLYSGIADERCEALYTADTEIEKLTLQRDAAMAIEWAVREWAAGRLTDEGLRAQLADGMESTDDQRETPNSPRP